METPNLNYINSLSGGDKQFERKLISIIKEEYPNEVREYQTNFIRGDLKSTAANVHKIKHKISIFGLEKSYALAADYEKNLIEGSVVLAEEFSKILQTISNYLKTL